MASKSLFETVLWGTTKQVQDVLDHRELTIDDEWTDYSLLVIALRKKRKEVAKILLKKGCRVERVPRIVSSDTPLHYAIKIGDIEILQMLLSRGASVDNKTQNGETALHLAMKNNKHEIVDLILTIDGTISANISDDNGYSYFHIACSRNNVVAIEKFLRSGIDINGYVNLDADKWPGWTPLHFAVEYNCPESVKFLLNHRADPTIKNADDDTPLHLAVKKKNDFIANMILSLLDNNNFNPIDSNGLSHFHIACMKSHLIAVENLLQRGIEINHAVNLKSSTWAGYTPLHFAVKGLSPNQLAVTEILLRHKADVNARDNKKQTPLHLACSPVDKKIKKKVLQNIKHTPIESMEVDVFPPQESSDIFDKIKKSKIVDLLLRYKSDVNAKNCFDETPLLCLFNYDNKSIEHERKEKEFLNDHKEILKILLENNADVNMCNIIGETILHILSKFASTDSAEEQILVELAELVLSKGAKVDAKHEFNRTPLHLASLMGHAKLIEVLLSHGADVNCLESIDKSSALHNATHHPHVEAIEVLLKHNADVGHCKTDGMNVLHMVALMNPAVFEKEIKDLIKVFVEAGCDLNARDVNGRTPLHLAAWHSNSPATWTLLQYFADVNVEDHSGETPLMFAKNNLDADIYFIFRDFLDVLKLTGLPVSEKNRFYYHALYSVKREFEEEDNFLEYCNEEIAKLKSFRINKGTTLFDIIFKDSAQMEAHSGNESFENALRSQDFNEEFEIFGNFLRLQYKKGLWRKALLSKAKNCLEGMIGLRLPDCCSQVIFSYLSEGDLKNVIAAEKVPDFDEDGVDTAAGCAKRDYIFSHLRQWDSYRYYIAAEEDPDFNEDDVIA